jgi:hypothetical protein
MTHNAEWSRTTLAIAVLLALAAALIYAALWNVSE